LRLAIFQLIRRAGGASLPVIQYPA
jgi:hypothetical protein